MLVRAANSHTGPNTLRIVLLIVVVVGITVAANHAWQSRQPIDATEALERGYYSLAMHFLLEESDRGDSTAKNAIGNLYFLGLGVEQDHAIAADWYREAAFAGNAQARVNMGHIHRVGGESQEHSTLSYAWFNLARNQGHTQAQLYMSELLRERRLIHHLVNKIRRDYATIDNFRTAP